MGDQVQSRIKAIERETVVEAVEEEAAFSFSFSDAGPLGRPVVQIEGVTFGYDKAHPLFCNVHLGIDQSSRCVYVCIYVCMYVLYVCMYCTGLAGTISLYIYI